jgi:hypothetical protein
MDPEKEAQRVVSIAQAQAATALNKAPFLREAFLGNCRTNWKKYAGAINRDEAACELFADQLDRATRDFMAILLQESSSSAS